MDHASAADAAIMQADLAMSRRLLIAETRSSMRKAMVEALMGHRATVPAVRFTPRRGPVIEQQPVALALRDMMDKAEVCGQLLKITRNPGDRNAVAAFITIAANSYADAHAPLIAQVHP